MKSAAFCFVHMSSLPVECNWLYLWQVIACIGALSAVLADRQLDTLMRTAFESLWQVNTANIEFITLPNWQLAHNLQVIIYKQHAHNISQLTNWVLHLHAFVCQDVAGRRQICRVKIRQAEVTMTWQTLTNRQTSFNKFNKRYSNNWTMLAISNKDLLRTNLALKENTESPLDCS